MLKEGVFCISYLPPIEYFTNILLCNEIFIERNENFIKQTYRNRMNIPAPNGIQTLSIPVKKTHNQHQQICDVEICNITKWQAIHWKSIETAYNSSPFFLYYKDEFLYFYKHEFKNLFDYNLQLLKLVLELLNINVKISFTDKYIKEYNNELDFRSNIISKKIIDKNANYNSYFQVFSYKYGFIPNMSIIDLIFNEGKYSKDYLLKYNKT